MSWAKLAFGKIEIGLGRVEINETNVLCVNEAYLSRYTTLPLTTTVLGLETIFFGKTDGWLD